MLFSIVKFDSYITKLINNGQEYPVLDPQSTQRKEDRC